MKVKINIIKIKNYRKNSGELIPIYFDQFKKIKVKRIFFLNIKKNFIRGNHAHKKTNQIFYQLKGSSELILSNKKSQKKIGLNEKKKVAVIVKPRTWVQIKATSSNCCLMVLCDTDYKKSEYINNFKYL